MDQNQNKPLAGVDTRRNFLKKAATVAAVAAVTNPFKTPVYGQNQAPSPGRVIGANDRIVVGHIGVGNQGMAHVRSQKEHANENNIAQVAVCDLSQYRIGFSKDYILKDNPDAKVEGFADHRKLLERKDIDAVTIATVDHWHAPIAIDAMNAGKHVYVEKPITRYLGEVFGIQDTVVRTGKVLQVGSQICSDARWHKAAELIQAGKLGQLVLAQDSYMRNNDKGEWNYTIMPWCTKDDLDWQRWQGQVHHKTEFNPDAYFRWRKYYPYCAGLLGDLVPHRLHPLMLATGAPEFPKRVVCLGNRAVHTDKNTPGTPERDVPEQIQIIAEFPSGLNLLVTSSTINQVGLPSMIRGHKATLLMGGDRIELQPEKPFADDIDPQVFEHLTPSGEKIYEMEKNWFDCVRSGQKPYANIDLAVRVQTVISLAEMSERLNIMCLFDEKTRKITTGDGKEVKALTYGWTELS
jgi:predicted dehydrogenase